MPLYEYECNKCSHLFELRRSFNDGGEACCPQCQSEARRLFKPVPIIFKGSGFYVTDHRAPNPAAKTEEKAGGSESKSESSGKPETSNSTESSAKAESSPKTTGATKSDSSPTTKTD